MKRLRRPEYWLLLALVVLSVIGSVLLTTTGALNLTERERGSYGLRPYWQAAFDATSAVCGVGLLSFDLEQQYTDVGRWILLVLGLIGAVLYVIAFHQAVISFFVLPRFMLPSRRVVLGLFGLVLALAAGIVALAGRYDAEHGGIATAVWNGLSTGASLGWWRGPRVGWLIAVTGFLGALGWGVWLAMFSAQWRRLIVGRRVGYIVGGYVLVLIVAAAAIVGLETRRENGRGRGHQAPNTSVDMGRRGADTLWMTVAAGTSGVPTQAPGPEDRSDGTLAVLGFVELIGGVGGSATGGVGFVLVLVALGWIRAGQGPRAAIVSARVIIAQLLLTCVVAIGLLLLSTWLHSSYEIPPTFGAALLDASGAVSGAAVTAGVSGSITGLNLSSGMGRSVDGYQYGMAWLMAAMWIGRVLPLFIIGHAPQKNTPGQ